MPTKARLRRPTISIVGPGNLGSALALSLRAAGHTVASIAVRPGSKSTRQARNLARRIGAQLIAAGKQPLSGNLVWITVPDDAITGVADVLARSGEWRGKVVLHSSGAVTSDALAPLRAKGAHVASVHPMMTFVRHQHPEMSGVAFALEGDPAATRAARAIIEELGGKPFAIRKENKVLYHAFGSFASPMVVALIAAMEEVALAAGIRGQDVKGVIAPLLQQTIRNYLTLNAAAAFSGPIVRGDVATVRKHLEKLEKLPRIREVYRVLASAALHNLPVKNAKSLAKELKASVR
ncbi:MAG TPA: DUF2520 domain-containing protein [Terriglobales bacterium]|nr:DUF2520 domain-containing protein [Terriglobales bacterium]